MSTDDDDPKVDCLNGNEKEKMEWQSIDPDFAVFSSSLFLEVR